MNDDTTAHAATLSIVVPAFNERYLVAESLTRLLNLQIDGVSTIEIVVVDDASTDGTREVLERIAAEHPTRIRLFRQERNQGKGAALRRGIEEATGDLIVFHDADLEYDPRELGKLVAPFWENGADVVYGSRCLTSDRRRVLYFRHTLGNHFLTFLSNLLTDLNLTDVETCYKMFRGPLLKSIPIRSSDFRVEVELTAKVAKRNCRVYEVPISYHGRTYSEGKKIGWRDGAKALLAMLRFWLIDDLYKDDAYGGAILHALEKARRFNEWMTDGLRPWLGHRVLEVGAGIGNLTSCLIPRDLYVASDLNVSYLGYLRNLAAGKPYLKVARVDLEDGETFASLGTSFDTVVCCNVLEHVRDPVASLKNVYHVLSPGGRLVLYVPAMQKLYSSLDDALGHRCRYDVAMLERELRTAGFEPEHFTGFNRAGVPGWLWNGKVLRRRTFDRSQLKIFDLLVPVLRRVDHLLPWPGLGIIAVAKRPLESRST
jgi:glycosyltransferase involved in cell wall biosynthesis